MKIQGPPDSNRSVCFLSKLFSYLSLLTTVPSHIFLFVSTLLCRPEYFNVYSNKLTGTIPDNLRWRKVINLDLGRNQFTGTVETIVDKFVELRMLFLDHNQFNGTVPSTLINSGNGRLVALQLDNNQFTGEVPGDHLYTNTLGKSIQRLHNTWHPR
jgi:hypothetical protein